MRDQAREVYLYGLFGPSTYDVHYIGITRKPFSRNSQHIYQAKNGDQTNKAKWIRRLLAEGNRPIFSVIMICSETSATCWEQWWIKTLLENGGKLTNETSGGQYHWTHSEETKRVLRDTWKPRKKIRFTKKLREIYREAQLKRIAEGRHNIEQLKEVNSRRLKGIPQTEERKSILRESAFRQWEDPRFRDKITSLQTWRSRQPFYKYPNRKLDDLDVLEIRTMLRKGYRSCDLAIQFEVNRNTILNIKKNRIWVGIQPVFDTGLAMDILPLELCRRLV